MSEQPGEWKPNTIVRDLRGIRILSEFCRVGAKYRIVAREQKEGLLRLYVAHAMDRGGGVYQFDLEGDPLRFEVVKEGKFPVLVTDILLSFTNEPQFRKKWQQELQLRVQQLLREIAATTPQSERPIAVFKAAGAKVPKKYKRIRGGE